jgi:hypothetical protein
MRTRWKGPCNTHTLRHTRGKTAACEAASKRRQRGVKNGHGLGVEAASKEKGVKVASKTAQGRANPKWAKAHTHAHAKLKAKTTHAHTSHATKQVAAVATQNSRSPAVQRAYSRGLSNYTRKHKHKANTQQTQATYRKCNAELGELSRAARQATPMQTSSRSPKRGESGDQGTHACVHKKCGA